MAAEVAQYRLDVVVHNAGWAGSIATRPVTVDGLEADVPGNALAPYLLQTLIPMPRRLVFVSSDSITRAAARPRRPAAHPGLVGRRRLRRQQVRADHDRVRLRPAASGGAVQRRAPRLDPHQDERRRGAARRRCRRRHAGLAGHVGSSRPPRYPGCSSMNGDRSPAGSTRPSTTPLCKTHSCERCEPSLPLLRGSSRQNEVFDHYFPEVVATP